MIAVDSVTRNSDDSWTFTWTAMPGVDAYRVVLWGSTLAVTEDTSFVWDLPGYHETPPPLEIVPEGEAASSELHPARVTLQWYAVPGASHYLVERLVDAQWEQVDDLTEDGRWVYSHTSEVLDDDTVYTHRVAAVSLLGDRSPTAAYTRRVVCPPPPATPDVAITYTPGLITVSEA